MFFPYAIIIITERVGRRESHIYPEGRDVETTEALRRCLPSTGAKQIYPEGILKLDKRNLFRISAYIERLSQGDIEIAATTGHKQGVEYYGIRIYPEGILKRAQILACYFYTLKIYPKGMLKPHRHLYLQRDIVYTEYLSHMDIEKGY